MTFLIVPKGKFHTSSENAAAQKRKELRKKLLSGEEVKVSQTGTIHDAKEKLPENQPAIRVPPGKLAASFFWYEKDPRLLKEERDAMIQFFPHFKLSTADDNRLFWHGELETNLRSGGKWYIQAIYDHNHPHNSTYGGSVKVYSIDPILEEIQEKLDEPIPHILTDQGGHLYLCTARAEDVDVGNMVTSAASSISWAVKWISAFELWMAGDLSTREFGGHTI